MKTAAPIPLFIISLFLLVSFKQDKPAYLLFSSKGKQVKYAKMINDLSGADMIFFGESHNNPIAHWLEYEVTRSLYQQVGKNLVMGAEMFEADNQLIMNEYLGGLIPADKFEAEARLWKNYKTDYKPLVTFAHDSGLVFIADNIPRRYASLVSKKGFEILDSLSDAAKAFIHPLPVPYDPEVRCYKDMLDMMGDTGTQHMSVNFPKAQAVKDATMAYFIYQNWQAGKHFLHFNGSYHSDRHEGIIWYLRQMDSALVIRNITVTDQEILSKPDSTVLEKADYIIVVPENMTKTY
ncbi:MAG: ChaN family lipoprotein [Chlorobi bacterium]|nr:ChaN family lipoprotein [Chlorobiota bacterium]